MYLWLLSGHATHILRVQLHGVVAQFSFRCCLQIMTSHRQVAVSLYPPIREEKQVGRGDQNNSSKLTLTPNVYVERKAS